MVADIVQYSIDFMRKLILKENIIFSILQEINEKMGKVLEQRLLCRNNWEQNALTWLWFCILFGKHSPFHDAFNQSDSPINSIHLNEICSRSDKLANSLVKINSISSEKLRLPIFTFHSYATFCFNFQTTSQIAVSFFVDFPPEHQNVERVWMHLHHLIELNMQFRFIVFAE